MTMQIMEHLDLKLAPSMDPQYYALAAAGFVGLGAFALFMRRSRSASKKDNYNNAPLME